MKGHSRTYRRGDVAPHRRREPTRRRRERRTGRPDVTAGRPARATGRVSVRPRRARCVRPSGSGRCRAGGSTGRRRAAASRSCAHVDDMDASDDVDVATDVVTGRHRDRDDQSSPRLPVYGDERSGRRCCLSRMQEREERRSRAGGRLVLVSMKAGPLSRQPFVYRSARGVSPMAPARDPSGCTRGSGHWSGAHLCIASSDFEGQVSSETLRWRNCIRGCQAARRNEAPAEAKGWLRVSMYRIASVSFWARSICATLAARWRPRRRLVRW